jgi:hypothetical protein
MPLRAIGRTAHLPSPLDRRGGASVVRGPPRKADSRVQERVAGPDLRRSPVARSESAIAGWLPPVRAFELQCVEVTFAEWDACAAHGDCTPHIDDHGWGRHRQPVINVSWNDAQRYVASRLCCSAHRRGQSSLHRWTPSPRGFLTPNPATRILNLFHSQIIFGGRAMTDTVEFNSCGDVCKGVLTRPGGKSDNVPLVIMAGGWCYTKEIVMPWYGKFFEDLGCATLRFDYRRFGESTGEPRQHLNPWDQIEDYRNALTFAETLSGIDNKRTGIWGILTKRLNKRERERDTVPDLERNKQNVMAREQIAARITKENAAQGGRSKSKSREERVHETREALLRAGSKSSPDRQAHSTPIFTPTSSCLIEPLPERSSSVRFLRKSVHHSALPPKLARARVVALRLRQTSV